MRTLIIVTKAEEIYNYACHNIHQTPCRKNVKLLSQPLGILILPMSFFLVHFYLIPTKDTGIFYAKVDNPVYITEVKSVTALCEVPLTKQDLIMNALVGK